MKRYGISIWELIKLRIWSFRSISFLIVLFFALNIYIHPLKKIVEEQNCTINILVMPFLQQTFYFMKLVLLVVLYFYSTAPFVKKEEMFRIMRIGKRQWGQQNLIYIFVTGFAITCILFLFQFMQFAPAGAFSIHWTTADKVFTLTDLADTTGISFDYALMQEYSPLALGSAVFFVDCMGIIFIALLLYTLTLWGNKVVAYLVCILVVFSPDILETFSQSFFFYQPITWLKTNIWRVGDDLTKPDLAYILVAQILLISILCKVSQWRVESFQWASQEE